MKFLYQTTDYWYPECERSLLRNDPDVGMDWGIDMLLTIAAKDANGVPFKIAEVFE